MKKSILVFMFAVVISTSSYAGEKRYGIGVDVNGGQVISFPIYTDGLIIEPLLFIYNETSEDDSSQSEVDIYAYGVGIFKHKKYSQQTSVYYGARLGATKTKLSYSYTSYSTVESEGKGVFLSPTWGAQYFITPDLSMSMEVSLSYVDDNTTYSYGSSSDDISYSSYSTNTGIMLRFLF